MSRWPARLAGVVLAACLAAPVLAADALSPTAVEDAAPPPIVEVPAVSPPEMGALDPGVGVEEVQLPPVSAAALLEPEQPNPTMDRGCVRVTPGRTELIRVALGQPNRLVMPWPRPAVTYADEMAVEVVADPRNGVVYVTPSEERPYSFFVTNGEDQRVAISIALSPQKMAPQQVCFELPGAVGSATTSAFLEPAAEVSPGEVRWEVENPYTDTLAQVLLAAAKGEIPRGYAMAPLSPGEAPSCFQPGLTFSFARGQRLLGGRLEVLVGTVRNDSGAIVKLHEPSCAGDPDVAAVAAWPEVRLGFGATSELFVVRRLPGPRETRPRRPSLVTGLPR